MFELKATQQKKASLNCGSTGRNQKHVFHISKKKKKKRKKKKKHG